MNLRDLTFVMHVADFGSVTRAARILRIDASTVSRHLGRFEDELGVLLFERGPGGMKTTPAGKQILKLARRINGDVEAIRIVASRSSHALVGELKLAIQTATLGPQLRAALMAWRKVHKGVLLQLAEVNDTEALSGLQERRIDAAVIYEQPLDNLAHLMLWVEPFLLAVPESHPLAARVTLQWSDVRAEKVVIRDAGGGDTLRRLQVGLLGPGVDILIQRTGPLQLLALVAMGEDVALTCGNHRELAFPGVRYVAIDEPDARISVALAWRTELEDPVVGSFVAFMRDWVTFRPPAASIEPSRTPDRRP